MADHATAPDDYLSLINPLWSTRELRGRVEAVRRETADAVPLLIRPGWGWSGHQAGQYVGVGVDIDGVRHWRTYSLTSPPPTSPLPPGRRDDRLSVTVKAIPNGRVSQHLVRRPGQPPGGTAAPSQVGEDNAAVPTELEEWLPEVHLVPVGAAVDHQQRVLRVASCFGEEQLDPRVIAHL